MGVTPMTRKLLIVFASGLVLAMVLLSAAWAIGGQAMLARIDKQGGWNFTFDEGAEAGSASRTLTFDPAQRLAIDAPVRLRFTRADQSRMTVRGPERLLAGLRWQDGRLWLDHHGISHHTLVVDIAGPRMPDLAFQGAGMAELDGLDQPALTIDLSGAGSIEARGRVERLTVNSSGAGRIDLEDLEARDANVSSSGVGLIDLSATGKVDASLSGAGRIALHRKPAQLSSSVSGMGVIDQDY